MEDDERVSPLTKIGELFKLIDQHKQEMIDDLKYAVSIPSIFSPSDNHKEIIRMFEYCARTLEDLGAVIDVVDGNGKDDTDLPPVLFANLFTNEECKTICVYGNIDTLSPTNESGDKQAPFQLIEKSGRLYGCGVSDNKAPLLCWFNALKIYKNAKIEVPVNIKFLIEATSECGSKSLFNAIMSKRNFFSNVEYVCLTIDKRINEMPCLKYSCRGLILFSLHVMCGDKRIHGGTYGGAFNQPLMDGVNIIGSLLDKQGNLDLPDFLKAVRPITEEDIRRCEKEYCPVEELKKETGVKFLCHKEKPSRLVMHKTCLPSFTIHAFHIKSALADKDDCSSIPNKIAAVFSARLVSNQKVDTVHQQFKRHIAKLWVRYKTANTYELKLKKGYDPWQEDPTSDHFKAASAAIKKVYGKSPIYIAEGRTIPAVSACHLACPASNMIVMPISGPNDCHHLNTESISVTDYIQGVKLAIAYMCEVHELSFKT